MRCVRFSAAIFMALAITPSDGAAKAVTTTIAPPRLVTIGDLLGRTPSEVQAMLAPQAESWPIVFALEAGTSADHWAAAQARDLLEDPATVEAMARFRHHANIRPASQRSCKLTTESGEDTPFTLLVFENGHLTSVWDGAPGGAVDPAGLSADDVLRRDGRTRLSFTDRRMVSCEQTTFEPGVHPSEEGPLDTVGFMQGLALLPFAVALPGMNAHRVAAKYSGAELYDRLAPGTALPPDVTGVRRVEGFPEQGFATLVVDLGAYSGRNLTDFDDHGVVAVHEGRVVWRSLPWTGAALAPMPPSH